MHTDLVSGLLFLKYGDKVQVAGNHHSSVIEWKNHSSAFVFNLEDDGEALA